MPPEGNAFHPVGVHMTNCGSPVAQYPGLHCKYGSTEQKRRPERMKLRGTTALLVQRLCNSLGNTTAQPMMLPVVLTHPS